MLPLARRRSRRPPGGGRVATQGGALRRLVGAPRCRASRSVACRWPAARQQHQRSQAQERPHDEREALAYSPHITAPPFEVFGHGRSGSAARTLTGHRYRRATLARSSLDPEEIEQRWLEHLRRLGLFAGGETGQVAGVVEAYEDDPALGRRELGEGGVVATELPAAGGGRNPPTEKEHRGGGPRAFPNHAPLWVGGRTTGRAHPRPGPG